MGGFRPLLTTCWAVRLNRSTNPLPCGWYGVVWIFRTPRRLHIYFTSSDSNCRPWLLCNCSGCGNRQNISSTSFLPRCRFCFLVGYPVGFHPSGEIVYSHQHVLTSLFHFGEWAHYIHTNNLFVMDISSLDGLKTRFPRRGSRFPCATRHACCTIVFHQLSTAWPVEALL